MTGISDESAEKKLLKKAIDLFTFLGGAQQLLAKPARTLDQYEKVLWFGNLPDHLAIASAHRSASPDPDSPLLTLQRVPKIDAPAPPDVLLQWLATGHDDPNSEPQLRDSIYVDKPSVRHDSLGEDDVKIHRLEIADAPEVAALFDGWMVDWRLWADRERRDKVVRDLYKEMFAVHLSSTDHSEEFELVLGVGCLSWRPEDHVQVRRHLATAPVAIGFDESTGQLTVTQVAAPEAVSIEVDMLDPSQISSPATIDEIRQMAAEYEGHLLDQAEIGDICRRLTHRLDADAEYDDEALDPPATTSPRTAFAPALILRRRTNRGLVKIYETIVSQLRATSEIPSGILPLIDPDMQPVAEVNSTPGAVVSIDDEDFLPLPVNEQQRRIIDRVDQTAQTVVQGPPGTGKTHTAAALVSHLLAKGLRVLITAQTDRALQEVRAKLPKQVQSLAVSVIGQSRTDMADLRMAVDSISKRADEFDIDDSRRSIDAHLTKIDQLRRERAETYHRLLTIRSREIENRTDGPEEGTLAAIAYRHLQREAEFSWIRDFSVKTTGPDSPVSSEEIMRWRSLLLDQDVIANESEAAQKLPDVRTFPTAAEFSLLVDEESAATGKRDSYDKLLSHQSFEFVKLLKPELREELRVRVSELAAQAAELERREEAWMNDALHDVRTGRHQAWLARSQQIKQFDVQASDLIQRFGAATTFSVAAGGLPVHQQIAKSLLAHIDSGKEIKVLPDGSPKIGTFASKTLKSADGFFAQVKINGLPAVSRGQLAAFIDWVEADRIVNAMDAAWPTNVVIPEEDTLGERVQWHRTEVVQLDKVLALGERLRVERAWFESNGLPVPDWNNLDEIRRFASLVEAASAVDAAATSSAPIEQLSERLRMEGAWSEIPAVTADFRKAVETRDVGAYAAAHARLTHLASVARAVAERDRIRVALAVTAPRLAAAIAEDPQDFLWDGRLNSFGQAWRWEMTGRWILAQDSEDANALKVRLNGLEQQIRTEVEHLAAERAWQHAVSPGRLTGKARANLTQYAQLVSALGKGTGKYAAKKRGEIAEAMDRCRPSVPVWIMPLYRIAEQMRVQPNLYDVVIVDEASQAGLEASFLQYLAPKIVVIGDDKQVSPSAVGVDQQQLRDLANLYLANDTYRASWLDPKRSYFDEANMRFGGRITLTEHRRCVPEIIGFSNRIAYEPEGIRLIPVRQFGADRLDPIKVVHVTDGVESANKTNAAEAEAVVEQIRECIGDPRYKGATIGVISLTGKEQARLIEHKLLDAIPPEEWAARELRCGDAPDFQGSERDVIFLSMVKSPSEDKRIMPLTMPQYVQRFNVAASRAKDQMWVYHSVPREALSNTQDMRFQLLDYCYGVVNRASSDLDTPTPGTVPEDVVVPPFDSLFEQRVFNRIADRGYTVIPQYPALGYNIDLVIVGATHRLAVECDGDNWHGPAQYESDLSRQRELERCGWKFFRIRESVFYADMPGALQKLWETLDELDIHAADWVAPDVKDDDESDNVDSTDYYSAPLVEESATPAIEFVNEVLESQSEQAAVGRHRAPEWLESHLESEVSAPPIAEPIEDLDDTFDKELAIEDPAAEEEQEKAVATGLLAPYRAFNDPLPEISATDLADMVSNVVRIVECEGPILGLRLHQVYVKASGGRRVGRDIARQLNRAITLAEKRGLIVSENPLAEAGVKPKTFRTPAQSSVDPRELGPRTLDSVPPAELAHHLVNVTSDESEQSDEEIYRAVLDLLGLKRLTENARVVLGSAMGLAGLAGRSTSLD